MRTKLRPLVCLLLLPLVPIRAYGADCTDAARTLSDTVREGLGTEAAETSLKRVIAMCPELAEAHFHLGVSLLERHHADEAVTSFKKSLELKKDPHFLVALGNAYAETKQLDLARDAYSESLKYDAKSPRALQGLAAIAIEQKQFGEAEETLRRAIQIAPDEAALFFNLGIVLEQTGRFDEALESFRAATLRKPSYLAAQLHLATVSLRVGRYQDAERILRPLTLHDARNAHIWLALGAATEGLGDFEAALGHVDRALTIDPELVPAQVNRAILLVKTGRAIEGRDRLIALATTNSNFAPAHSALGWAYLQSEQLDQAETSLMRALELDPRDGFAQNNLGVLYSLKGDGERAKRAFEKARELRPGLKESEANIKAVVE